MPFSNTGNVNKPQIKVSVSPVKCERVPVKRLLNSFSISEIRILSSFVRNIQSFLKDKMYVSPSTGYLVLI